MAPAKLVQSLLGSGRGRHGRSGAPDVSLHPALQTLVAHRRMPLTADRPLPPAAGGWSARLAGAVSTIASPPVLTVAGVLQIALAIGGQQALPWAVLYIALAVLTPLVYLVRLLRGGSIGDLDVRRRTQRFRPLAVTELCQAIGLAVLVLGHAPVLLARLAAAVLALTTVILLITWRWKISVHCGAASLVLSQAAVVTGTLLPLLVVLPLLIWSRLLLNHHTTAQTLLGTALGGSVFLLFVVLVPGG